MAFCLVGSAAAALETPVPNGAARPDRSATDQFRDSIRVYMDEEARKVREQQDRIWQKRNRNAERQMRAVCEGCTGRKGASRPAPREMSPMAEGVTPGVAAPLQSEERMDLPSFFLWLGPH